MKVKHLIEKLRKEKPEDSLIFKVRCVRRIEVCKNGPIRHPVESFELWKDIPDYILNATLDTWGVGRKRIYIYCYERKKRKNK